MNRLEDCVGKVVRCYRSYIRFVHWVRDGLVSYSTEGPYRGEFVRLAPTPTREVEMSFRRGKILEDYPVVHLASFYDQP